MFSLGLLSWNCVSRYPVLILRQNMLARGRRREQVVGACVVKVGFVDCVMKCEVDSILWAETRSFALCS